jgi:hypothetical protein
MDFLLQRYISALARDRSLISDYRDGQVAEDRHSNIKDQVLLLAAILLIITLIAAALASIFQHASALKYVSVLSALGGLLSIVIAAAIAIKENSIIQRAIDSELLDVPEPAEQIGQKPGAIAYPNRI